MKKVSRTTILIILLLGIGFSSALFTAFANPPAPDYVAGETLDPTCAPGDPGCTVAPVSIGGAVSLGTSGSLLYVDASGTLAEDNDDLYWDPSTNRLGIGNNTPGYRLDIAKSEAVPASIGTPVEVGGGALDDLSVGGTYTGGNDDTLYVYFDATGTPDQFGWYDDNFDYPGASNIPITGGAQALTGTGVTVTFGATTGHDGNEVWAIPVSAAAVGTTGDLNFGGSIYKGGDLWSGAIGGTVDNALNGGVLYVDSSGLLRQDTGTFAYDDSTNSLFVANLGFTSESSSAGIITFGSERLHSYGTSSAFWGVNAGNFTLTGSNNIGIGTNAGAALTTGAGNVCLGQQTCQVLTIGQNNIMIGKKTGEGQSSGNNNILIGFDLDSPLGSTSSSALNIGNTIYGDMATGSIGIGDASITSKFSVGSGGLFRVNSTGLAFAPAGAAATPAWSFVSDTDTGIFQNGANVLGLSTGGTTRVTVNSSGLGVGVTPDQSLDISGNFEFPATNASATAGVIYQNGSRIFHTYGDGTDTNIFLGKNAGNFTTNTGGIGIGAGALQSLTDGEGNIVLGTGGGRTITSGNRNTLIGEGVMDGLTIQSGNTALGAFAGREAFGSNNIFIGHDIMNAPDPFLTNNNIIIGNEYDLETIGLPQTSDLFIIDPDIDSGGYPFIYGEFDNNILVFNTSAIGIGDMSPDFTLDVEQIADGVVASFTDDDNNCTIDPDIVGGISCTSDARRKEHVEDLGDALSSIRELRPVTYDFKGPDDDLAIGFIAQEIQDVYPSLVTEDSRGYLTLSYAGLTPILTKAIQELDMEVQDLSSLDASMSNSLGALITSLLADAGNGIQDIFTHILHADRVETNELCVGDTCVTEEEFLDLVHRSGNGDHDDSHEDVPPSGDTGEGEETGDDGLGSSQEETGDPVTPEEDPVVEEQDVDDIGTEDDVPAPDMHDGGDVPPDAGV